MFLVVLICMNCLEKCEKHPETSLDKSVKQRDTARNRSPQWRRQFLRMDFRLDAAFVNAMTDQAP